MKVFEKTMDEAEIQRMLECEGLRDCWGRKKEGGPLVRGVSYGLDVETFE